MDHTQSEVLSFIEENDVQFVRLSFCDPFGAHKNISIMPDQLPAAFENGVSFDASAIRGFLGVANSDLFLFPMPETLTVLPWRPGPGRVVRFYCEIRNPDGTPFLSDSRYLLGRVLDRCHEMGYVCRVGAECEFYLFKTDDDGNPIKTPLDNGGYLDIAPLDRGENIRREICLCLKEMGIEPVSSHHEQGPGQNEIDFKFSEALSSADNLMTLKAVVKAIAQRNGLFASFMPKPIADCAGSGLHINLSLTKNGANIFGSGEGGQSPDVESFIAGILYHAAEITLLLNPLPNSYERFGKFAAPEYVSWSHQNRSQLIRIPAATGERVRMELRSPDPSLNPYLAYALIIAAGLDGIEKGQKLPPRVDEDLYVAGGSVTGALDRLPRDLGEAISLARGNTFIESVIGAELLAKIIAEKECEWARCEAESGIDRYFESI